MSDLAVETTALRKVFRTRRGVRVAVDGLDLAVPAHGVHGFLGPNGSGKTTTIRMLLGLARATGGEMRLLGHRVPEALPDVVGRVGAVVESPKFTPTFTGRQNLDLLARAGALPRTRVEESLERVGLRERGGDRYSAYSLGMKQRLAIAATLLKHPALLVLDEPTNGLDPAGIREIRELVRDLGRQGVAVLVSSHLLAEVQQVCTSASIVGRGRLLAQGPVDTLLGADAGHRVRVADATAAAAVLERAGFSVRRGPADAGALLVAGAPSGAAVARVLGETGHWVEELTPTRPDLESVFLELTSGHGLTATGDDTAESAERAGRDGAA